jgi:asparaginyl-tRNA synthetase
MSKQEKTMITKSGWIFLIRKQSDITFIQLMDGSSPKTLQLVLDSKEFDIPLSRGCSIEVMGTMVPTESGEEMKVSTLKLIGECDAKTYPVVPRATLEHLRTVEHLRIRTHTLQSVMRVRHTLSMAIHKFFDERGYFYVHTPLLTTSDCEGAGEAFAITTQYPKTTKPESMDPKKELFKQKTYLTVSGQLHGEAMAMGLGKIYTFGPTFRAEVSHTSRHLSEFWMIEPEVAFLTETELHQLTQDLVQYCVKEVLEKRKDDIEFLTKQEPTLKERLEKIVEKDFPRITYDEAVDILLKEEEKGKVFETKVSRGMDFGSEHEKHLTDEVFKSPVICYRYPKEIKAFYMKPTPEDESRVMSMDLLVPTIGELVGGSIREESYEKLKSVIESKKISGLEWYLDLRKYGSVPHGGFGIGFERLILLCTGMKHIRDVIPFPRYAGHCEF